MKKMLPGISLSLIIALIATFVTNLIPGEFIGASVLAIFIGVATRALYYKPEFFNDGVQYTSKKVLKLAIVLLGASLNFAIIMQVGGRTLIVLSFTLLTAFGIGHFLGKALGVNWKLRNMIAAGTAICGGSAIAAMAPAIEADDGDVSYAISATFLFDMFMIVVYPLVGRMLVLSDTVYGYWAGTSINDTSSVVAAGFAFSEAAGEIATMVKLTRTLAIIPTVLIFSSLYYRSKLKEPNRRKEKVDLRNLVPWFIIFFVLMAVLNTMGVISPGIAEILRTVSRFLMVVALAAIGLKTDLKSLVKTGWTPMIHGVLLSTIVVFVSYFVVKLIIT